MAFVVPSTTRVHTLPPTTYVAAVTLKVANLERMQHFYSHLIGLQLLQRGEKFAILGAGGNPILYLEHNPGAHRPTSGNTGLYHVALLFPDRRSLAVKILQLQGAGIYLGSADHLVSEAFYLSDPEGNGIELYRDRPREEWAWHNGQVQMDTIAVNFAGLVAEVSATNPLQTALQVDPAVPPELRLGHIHLRGSDLTSALAFYRDGLGFDLTCIYPGAYFFSAGGYHHHLAVNIWQSRGGAPAPDTASGLCQFTLRLPDGGALQRLAQHLRTVGRQVTADIDALIVYDPFQNRIRLEAEL